MVQTVVAGNDMRDVEPATLQDERRHSLSDYKSSFQSMRKNGAAKGTDIPDTSIARKDGRDR